MTNERQINRNGFFPTMNLSCLLLLTTDLNWLSEDKVDWETTGRPNDSSATVHGACLRAKTLFPRPHHQTESRPADP